MSSSLTTWNLPFGSDGALYHKSTVTYWGSIISFEPTVTAFAMACSPGCDGYTGSYTIGPWAQITPPPQVSGGIYEMYGVEPLSVFTETIDEFAGASVGNTHALTETTHFPLFTQTAHIRCEVTSTTQLGLCQQGINGWEDPASIQTGQFNATESKYFGATPIPVTITAGLEKLSSVAATTTASTGQASGGSGSSGTPTATTSAKASGNAASSVGPGSVRTMGLLGLVAAMFIL